MILVFYLNAANEVAVAAFLNKQIAFTDIAHINAHVLESAQMTVPADLESVIELDKMARMLAQKVIQKVSV